MQTSYESVVILLKCLIVDEVVESRPRLFVLYFINNCYMTTSFIKEPRRYELRQKENNSLLHNDAAKRYKISIIVAHDINLGIGKNGRMAWHCSADLQHFAKLTHGHIVVMGYNTYLALNKKPLPNRRNVVISDYHRQQIGEDFESFSNIYDFLSKYENEQIFCIGGAKLYQAFLPFASTMHITELQTAANVDTFFPNYNCSDWRCEERRFIPFDKDVKCAIEYRTLTRLY